MTETEQALRMVIAAWEKYLRDGNRTHIDAAVDYARRVLRVEPGEIKIVEGTPGSL